MKYLAGFCGDLYLCIHKNIIGPFPKTKFRQLETHGCFFILPVRFLRQHQSRVQSRNSFVNSDVSYSTLNRIRSSFDKFVILCRNVVGPFESVPSHGQVLGSQPCPQCYLTLSDLQTNLWPHDTLCSLFNKHISINVPVLSLFTNFAVFFFLVYI